MSHSKRNSASGHSDPARFATTRWSIVLAAGQRSSPESREALAALCQTYWYPLYSFIRRHGFPPHDAQDLTQDFFVRLLDKNLLGVVDREKGRFRSFLLASLKHFLANERDRARAQKRGGGKTPLPLDFETAEARFSLEPAHDFTPEKIFERRWALTTLEQVLGQLREEFARSGKAKLFDRLKVFLTGEKGSSSYADVAANLDMTAGAVKVAAHRLRRRYRELLRKLIAQTVAHPDDIDDEIRELFAALGD